MIRTNLSTRPFYNERAVHVALVYWLLGRINVAFGVRQLLTIGFAFTTHWWVAGMAGGRPHGRPVRALGHLVPSGPIGPSGPLAGSSDRKERQC